MKISMVLFIDTHALGSFRLGWIDGDRQDIRVYSGRVSGLLNRLDELSLDLSKVKEIRVVQGPGSFSAIRIGVLYANLLARLLQVPLIALSVHDSEMAEKESQTYVAPIYDTEPNITRSTTC